jgi:hypothetical protein
MVWGDDEPGRYQIIDCSEFDEDRHDVMEVD